MVPDELVGVEVGSVAGKEVDLEFAFQALDELGHDLRDVSRVSVDNEQDRPASASQEVLQKLDERLLVQSAGVDLIPERSEQVQRRDCAHGLALTARRNLGRVSLVPPRTPERSIGPDA